jgi:hypothetical protein
MAKVRAAFSQEPPSDTPSANGFPRFGFKVAADGQLRPWNDQTDALWSDIMDELNALDYPRVRMS